MWLQVLPCGRVRPAVAPPAAVGAGAAALPSDRPKGWLEFAEAAVHSDITAVLGLAQHHGGQVHVYPLRRRASAGGPHAAGLRRSGRTAAAATAVTATTDHSELGGPPLRMLQCLANLPAGDHAGDLVAQLRVLLAKKAPGPADETDALDVRGATLRWRAPWLLTHAMRGGG